MENVWITLAEIQVKPGDMSSGDTLGFMWVTRWATSEEDLLQKLNRVLPSTAGPYLGPKRLKWLRPRSTAVMS
jgi:hypothetical protein